MIVDTAVWWSLHLTDHRCGCVYMCLWSMLCISETETDMVNTFPTSTRLRLHHVRCHRYRHLHSGLPKTS